MFCHVRRKDGKLADIPFRDVNFLRYFGCSNICFLDFFISLANFRLTWRIVAPTRRKIARKLGDISMRIEREIRSHYLCKLPHTNTSTTSFFGWTRSTSCAFLQLAVTSVTSSGLLRLDFQLLAFLMFLRVNCKNIALSLLARRLTCSCGARTSCATSCACIIFGLYCKWNFSCLKYFSYISETNCDFETAILYYIDG